MIEIAIGETVETNIDSRKFWNETGYLLKKEQSYNIHVEPTSQTWTDGKLFSQTVDADGFSNWFLNLFGYLKRMKSAKWFALIGCINKDENTNFLIGIDCKNYSPPIDGELTCYANDAKRHYRNNNGILKINITRVK